MESVNSYNIWLQAIVTSMGLDVVKLKTPPTQSVGKASILAYWALKACCYFGFFLRTWFS